MDDLGEQSRFEIQPVIEQKPFENPAVQSFFAEWCRINDSIQPKIIDRQDWDQRGQKGILEKQKNGTQTLFIPKDLQLWEMIGVMETVDHDTFAAKPERQDEAKSKLLTLGKTFQNAGVYIAQRLSIIDEGYQIAGALAEEFYQYGQSLVGGEKPNTTDDIHAIAAHSLTTEEITAVDRFLAGDDLYESRQQRAEKASQKGAGETKTFDLDRKADFSEAERIKTLNQFFRTASKAFALKRKSDQISHKRDSNLKPWQNDTPIHQAFLDKVQKRITRQIETPKTELTSAIFRRGLETLVREMRLPDRKPKINTFFKKIGIDITFEQQKITDALGIDQLKTELEVIRNSGDLVQIGNKEREIADKIQKAVSSFPYEDNANNPSEMVANQFINCVGASTLGGALMKEVGLNYLVGQLPFHSMLFLITSDGQVEWRDLLFPSQNEKLTNDIIEGNKKDGSPVTIADIVAFSHAPKNDGLSFALTNRKHRIRKGQHQLVTILTPEYGQQIQLLNNTATAFERLGQQEEAILAYREAIALAPNLAYLYINLGSALRLVGRKEESLKIQQQAIMFNPKDANLYGIMGNSLYDSGHYREAIEAYKQAVDIDPQNREAYNDMGNSLSSLGQFDEALKVYWQAIGLDPKFAPPFNGLGNALRSLGHKNEAIAAYKEFIELADKKLYDNYIKRAKKIIAELQNT